MPEREVDPFKEGDQVAIVKVKDGVFIGIQATFTVKEVNLLEDKTLLKETDIEFEADGVYEVDSTLYYFLTPAIDLVEKKYNINSIMN